MNTLITILLSIGLVGFTGIDNASNQDKTPVRIYLDHYKNNEKHELNVRVLTKTDKRYRPAEDVEVALYMSEVSPQNLLGNLVTSMKGTATYTFTQDQFELAENMNIAHYFAVVIENETLKGKETEIVIRKVNLSAQFFVEDSIYRVLAKVSETDSVGNAVPLKSIKIQFLVERPLSPLPVGDGFYKTDESGNATMEFPDDLPGDEEGHIRAMVRIVENDDYGTVEVSKVIKWGIPTFVSDTTMKRSLWASSANAPILLLIFINSLIAAVWGIIFYIVIKIFKIRKLGM
jgi:hypothetical protein